MSTPPANQLETVDCNLCHWPSQRRRFSRNGYHIVECPNCSLRWVNPRPVSAVVNEVYGEDYFRARKIGGSAHDPGVEQFKRKNVLRHLEYIERHEPRGKLLEVGCAEGLFLRVAHERGWDVSGVELSPQAAAIAEAALPGKIFQGTLRDAKFTDGAFDVVALFDVVEHFPDPLTEMKEIFRVLRPGGLVFLLTPDCESAFARLMGPFWFEIKPNEHLYYFSDKTIGSLVEQSGLRLVETAKTGKTLTFEYIAQILDKSSRPFGTLLRTATRWTPFYSRPITYDSGFLVALARKP